jgi:hypothetical protein
MFRNPRGDRRPTTARSESAGTGDGQDADAYDALSDVFATHDHTGVSAFGPVASGASFMTPFTGGAAPQVAAQSGMGGFAPMSSIIPILKGVLTTVGKPPTAPVLPKVTAPTSTSTPSWIATLATPSLKTDMAAAVVNGAATYNGLLNLLNHLNSTLSSSNARLTTAQMKDLQTIAANLNTGMTTSAYLTNIMGALVKGDAANATWTGGAQSYSLLGNLAVGSSSAQLTKLIGKWFLGTDLPSSQVTMGRTRFNVSYSPVSGAAFASSGASQNDINQGYLGDCYLLAGLAEVAKQNPNAISSMVTANGNNTYGVRFYVNGVADYVTVNSSLANGGSIFNYGKNIWGSLVEKAYAQLQSSNSWTAIGNGGWPRYALEAITGASTITDYTGSSGSWSATTYNQSLVAVSRSTGYSTSWLQNTLISGLSKGYDAILTSWTNAKDSSGKTTLVASHAMSITGYNSATSMFQIRNPWGSESGQTWATSFEVSLNTLLAAGDTITMDNGPGAGALGSVSGVSASSGLKVKATDVGGSMLPETFASSITSAAANLTQAISSMASTAGSLTSSLTQLASATPATLAAPTHV